MEFHQGAPALSPLGKLHFQLLFPSCFSLQQPCSIPLTEALIIPNSLFLRDLWSIHGHGSALVPLPRWDLPHRADFFWAQPPIPEKSHPWDLNSFFPLIFPVWNCWEAAAMYGYHQVCKHGIFYALNDIYPWIWGRSSFLGYGNPKSKVAFGNGLAATRYALGKLIKVNL